MGARTSPVYQMMIAACTTSIGRQRIEDASTGVVEWALQKGYDKPQVVYGDTDSDLLSFQKRYRW